MSARVVITGMSGLTSLGSDWEPISEKMREQRSGIRKMDEWTQYDGLNTLLGGPILDFEVPGHYARRQVRSMGRVAKFSTVTAERAKLLPGRAAPEKGTISAGSVRLLFWELPEQRARFKVTAATPERGVRVVLRMAVAGLVVMEGSQTPVQCRARTQCLQLPMLVQMAAMAVTGVSPIQVVWALAAMQE